jgi:hypothetical protein
MGGGGGGFLAVIPCVSLQTQGRNMTMPRQALENTGAPILQTTHCRTDHLLG